MGQRPRYHRYYLHLPPDLLLAIDAWRFANAVETRAEALRLLLQRGLRVGALPPSPPSRKKGQSL